MAEAGLENFAQKTANSLVKTDVSPDAVQKVVPSFVPSGTVCEASGGITNDLRRAKLLGLVGRLTDRQVNDLVAIADKMLTE